MPLHLNRRSFLLGSGAALLLANHHHAHAEDWKQEWERTIALAKQEGSVTVAASANRGRREFITQQWKMAFPDIDLSYQVVRGSRFIPTVVTERKAGKYLWDVYNSGPPSGFQALQAGLLDPLLPELILPDANDPALWGGWDEAFYDPQKKYLLGLFRDITSPYYNTKRLDPQRVARLGLKILLEPDLKGKIYWLDPRESGPGEPYLALLYQVLGEDNLRRLLAEQDIVFVNNNNDAANAVVRGRALIALSNHAGEALSEYKNAGLEVDIRAMGNTPDTGWLGTGGGTIGLYNQRPHPNAARVLVNWLASRDVAVGLSRAQGLNSARKDVPAIDQEHAAIADAHYLNGQSMETMVTVNEWKRELKKMRPQ